MEMFPRFVNLIAALAIVAGLGVVAWWLIGMYGMRDRGSRREIDDGEPLTHAHEDARVPPVMIFFIAFIAVSMIAYMLYIWLGGVRY